MPNAILSAGTMLLPLLVIAGLLALAARRERIREATIARQVRLTDAIGAELGAVVAPTVRHRVGGAWRVRIAVPAGRPALVSRVVEIAHRALDRMEPGRYELVLTPQDPAVAGHGVAARAAAPVPWRRAA